MDNYIPFFLEEYNIIFIIKGIYFITKKLEPSLTAIPIKFLFKLIFLEFTFELSPMLIALSFEFIILILSIIISLPEKSIPSLPEFLTKIFLRDPLEKSISIASL